MEKKIHAFIDYIKTIRWFSNCGCSSSEYTVEKSIFSAFDDWNSNMLKVWEPHINDLEKTAQEALSDKLIDDIFITISNCIQDDLWSGYSEFIDRNNLENENGLECEILDCVKRDISWTCIESILNRNDFFHRLLHIYEKGRWACSWDGDYPEGRFVVM